MQVLLVGLSHRTTPVELRERLDFAARGVDRALAELAGTPSHSEAAIVSACNRVELYVACDDVEAARADIERFVSRFHGVPAAELAPHFYAKIGQDAVRHLLRVAAGLDSLVVGEPQVLGQVKDAYNVASEAGCTGLLLNKLFHSAFVAGKRVRTETALSEGAVSVSYAAVALARKIFGDLKGRQVLVIGAGEISSLTAQHLRAQGVGDIVITSRTHAHAEALAAEVGGVAVPWDGMVNALGSADIVITATGSQRPIITRAHLDAAGHRRSAALFILDIAAPRDVDPAVADVE